MFCHRLSCTNSHQWITPETSRGGDAFSLNQLTVPELPGMLLRVCVWRLSMGPDSPAARHFNRRPLCIVIPPPFTTGLAKAERLRLTPLAQGCAGAIRQMDHDGHFQQELVPVDHRIPIGACSSWTHRGNSDIFTAWLVLECSPLSFVEPTSTSAPDPLGRLPS